MGRAFLRSEATFLQWLVEVLFRRAEHGATSPPVGCGTTILL